MLEILCKFQRTVYSAGFENQSSGASPYWTPTVVLDGLFIQMDATYIEKMVQVVLETLSIHFVDASPVSLLMHWSINLPYYKLRKQ